MAGETKKELESGMYDCVYAKPKAKNPSWKEGDKVVYHSSTAQTLLDKGILKSAKKIKDYVPKHAKK